MTSNGEGFTGTTGGYPPGAYEQAGFPTQDYPATDYPQAGNPPAGAGGYQTGGYQTYPAAAYPAAGESTGFPAAPAGANGQHRNDQDAVSTADVARDQVSSVAGDAADAAGQVAGVAKEQAADVAAEAGRQVKHLIGQARSELTDQAGAQQQRAAGGLRSLSGQLSALVNGSPEPGVATDLARQAGDKVQELAGWLENRDPGALLEEVRGFARRRPGAFLALALGAGLVAGRLARGLTTDADDADAGTPQQRTPGLVARPAGAAGVSTGTSSAGSSDLVKPAVPAVDWPVDPVSQLGDRR